MEYRHANFANFICKFGDKNLLDYMKEIVVPAFFDDSLVRNYGKTTYYHLYDMELLDLSESRDSSVVGLCGRFIKDTELSRTQLFDPNVGLVKDSQAIRSSPSSFFVLILNNHRLIYLPETPHAPDIKSFEATMSQFLKLKHKKFIDDSYQILRQNQEKGTKKHLRKNHPSPTLEIIPLTGFDNIEQFVGQYKTLKSLELRLLKPNDDVIGTEVLKSVREYTGGMGPESTRLIVASTEGLDKDRTVEVIHDASAAGNQDVILKGIDESGNKLTGTNDKFKVSAKIDSLPIGVARIAEKLYAKFTELVSAGAIRVDSPTGEATRRIVRTLRGLI
jgi:hypothetical protein